MNRKSIGANIKILATVIGFFGIVIGILVFIQMGIVGIPIIVSSLILSATILGLGEVIVLLQEIRDSLNKDNSSFRINK